MSTTKHFTNFEYIVRSDFILENKREVIVLFDYLGIHRIKLSLFFNKEKGCNDEYYINEAKKIISQKIKDGSLEKHSEKCAKEQKKKKILSFAAPIVAGAMAIAGITVGTYFAVQPKSAAQAVKVDVPTIEGLTFKNKQAYIGQDYSTEISIDITKTGENRLPDELKSVKSGNRTITNTEYTYNVADNKESANFKIPGKYVEGDIKIDLELVKPTPPGPTPWYLDTTYLNGLTDTDVTKEGGEIQTLKVNGLEHRVRLIGVGEDYGTIGDPSTKIHTTWEFADLISDENGNSLVTQWNDTNDEDTANHKYDESTIHNALNGENVNNVLWAQKEETTWSSDYKCSVLDMLNEGNPGLVDTMKTPSKYTNIYNTTTTQWEETIVKDKLFLLSPAEMGRTEHDWEETSTHTYSYYEGTEPSGEELKRVKKQINDDVYAPSDLPEIPIGSGQVYEDSSVINYAGIYFDTPSMGNYMWTRSPYTEYNHNAWVINLSGDFDCYNNNVSYYAYAVAPAFCI